MNDGLFGFFIGLFVMLHVFNIMGHASGVYDDMDAYNEAITLCEAPLSRDQKCKVIGVINND